MKFSMHNWMRPEPIETTLERLHRFGYDGIEIMGDPERYNTAEVRGLLDKYNLECWGTVTMMFAGRDLLHPDKSVRRDTIQYCRDCLKMAHELEGQIFCIVPSTVGKVKPMASASEEWVWAVEGLKEITEVAGELGIRCGIEPLNRFETYFINRHDPATCRRINSYFPVCWFLSASPIGVRWAQSWRVPSRFVSRRRQQPPARRPRQIRLARSRHHAAIHQLSGKINR